MFFVDKIEVYFKQNACLAPAGNWHSMPVCLGRQSDQHLTSRVKKLMNFFLDLGVYHDFRAPAVWADQLRCGAKQAANQRALFIHFAAVFTQVGAAQVGKGAIVLCRAFSRQSCHFVGGGCHRTAAVMAAGYALERRYPSPEKFYFLAIAGHVLVFIIFLALVPN